ncbi:multidrug resistance efflux pump [Aliiruegeria haliotis]|uniref:Multidrug resistance efflux pump n=1 Tax=Aliiruegeria haliotis TaxID=1280846 RepID=A0A2T0RGE6_9RHOB|nr:HlyD family secretion protein [Aliiruegeria haliotis]PRY20235.1 multidrug resistance efflux pump [Aliiruegeria haliotis]
MKVNIKILVSAAILAVAAAFVLLKYSNYVTNPWTRNGQVRANVLEVAPRVSGPIINLPIRDNQYVEAGDLLFEIDPRTFKSALEQAQAKFDETVEKLASLDKQIDAARASVKQYETLITQAESQLLSAEAQETEAEQQYDRALVLVERGRLPEAQFDGYQRDLNVALANVDQARSAVLQAKAAYAQAQASLGSAIASRGARGEENSQFREANAALETARLNLEFTQVRAAVSGHITNLTLRLGSQAVANQPILALIDDNSFWVDAYFRESYVSEIKPGNRAAITLMSHPDIVIPGVVDSVGRGIAKGEGSTGVNLLPNVSPTFEWIRLAQRIPVRIELGEVPEDIDLLVGTTASVLVMSKTDTSDEETDLPPPAPSILR